MIQFRNITFGYDKQNILFKELNFEIKKNNFCSILGRSGSGKSTILYLISGIEQLNEKNRKWNSGSIFFYENSEIDCPRKFIESERRNIAMVFQTPSLFPHKTIFQNIAFVMKKKNKEAIIDFLRKIHMEKYIDSYPNQLSVGQQQRIAFARALLSNASIILLDEPFSGLDFESKFLLYNLLLEIKLKQEKTIILVTHDFDEAAFFSNQFLIVNEQQICHYNSIEEIYNFPCSRYIASLFQFTNILTGNFNEKNQTLETIFGEIKFIDQNGLKKIDYIIRPNDIDFLNKERNLSCEVLLKEIKFFGSYYIIICFSKKHQQMIFIQKNKIENLNINKKIFISPTSQEKIQIIQKK
jgi:ABC-type Fe3+/spermidine/putrescine transport system ATPase subunit